MMVATLLIDILYTVFQKRKERTLWLLLAAKSLLTSATGLVDGREGLTVELSKGVDAERQGFSPRPRASSEYIWSIDSLSI
jgi:hypothetical protein